MANIAVGKSYVLNYTPDGSYPDSANYATDGNINTYFGVQGVANPTITIDLKIIRKVNKVQLYSGWNNNSGYYATSIQVYYSTDNTNFISLGTSSTLLSSNSLLELSFTEIDARYIRVKVLSFNSDWYFMRDCQVYGNLMVGDALASPETGWKRYDDNDSRIKYIGTWTYYTADPNYINSTYHYSNTQNDTINFKFYGTKLRLLATLINSYSSDISVFIDNIKIDTLSEYSSNSTQVYKTLVYEKTGLNLQIHDVKLTNNVSGKYVGLDALDIDDTGYLTHPTLNQVSDITTMQVGDCIPCRYTATTSGSAGYFSELGTCIANEIPVTGNATPNGLFYFIKTEKGTLIADRVIQTNISWDVLNTTKFIEGGFTLHNNIIPPLTSDTDQGYVVSASNEYTAAYKPTNFSGWLCSGTSGWWKIMLPSSKCINSYSLMYSSDTNINRLPKTWTFEGSNDGNAWNILDTRTNITDWTFGVFKNFSFNNTNSYKYYRLNISANNGNTSFIGISSIKFQEASTKPIYIRSLTGGVAYTDTNGNSSVTDQNLGAWPPNNEWDSYLVKSDLNNKIVKGDDNIWHWKNLVSWVKDTLIVKRQDNNVDTGINTSRGQRGHNGSTFIINGVWQNPSSTINASSGFRPVLEYLESNSKATTLWY